MDGSISVLSRVEANTPWSSASRIGHSYTGLASIFYARRCRLSERVPVVSMILSHTPPWCDVAILMWTARLARQVNMTPYLFTDDLPHFTLNGSNRSTPLLVKGGSSGTALFLGKSAIICVPAAPCCLRQVVQRDSIFLIVEGASIIQYL